MEYMEIKLGEEGKKKRKGRRRGREEKSAKKLNLMHVDSCGIWFDRRKIFLEYRGGQRCILIWLGQRGTYRRN